MMDKKRTHEICEDKMKRARTEKVTMKIMAIGMEVGRKTTQNTK